MTDQTAGPRCGNNPNFKMSDGDRKAVDDFKARLALKEAAKPYIDRAVWVDGDPLMEVIVATVWRHCGRDSEDMPQLVCDDPRTIAALAAAVARAHAATDQAAEPLCVCGHPMRLHHEDVCLTECGCNDGLEAEATDLPDRLAAALTARFTERGNPFAEMRRHEQGPDGWPASHPVGPRHVAEVLRELLAAEARATAVLPAPADRAAVLTAAERTMLTYALDQAQEKIWSEDGFTDEDQAAVTSLRRLADETQQPEAEAHPPEHSWAPELYDPLAEEWVPGTRYITRDRAVNHLTHANSVGSTWKDGTPVQRRLVRATTTYTVETEPAAAVQQPKEARP